MTKTRCFDPQLMTAGEYRFFLEDDSRRYLSFPAKLMKPPRAGMEMAFRINQAGFNGVIIGKLTRQDKDGLWFGRLVDLVEVSSAGKVGTVS